jgi:hypothetical protein
MLSQIIKGTLFVTVAGLQKRKLRSLWIMASPIWTAYPGLQVQVQDVELVNRQYWIYWPNIADDGMMYPNEA